MGGLRSRAVHAALAVLAAVALVACGSSDPGPIQAGPGGGVPSGHHSGKHHHEHKHHGKKKHHHNHAAKHHHSGGSSSGGGSGNGGGSGGGSGPGSGGGSGGGGGSGSGGGSGHGGGSGGGGHAGGGHGGGGGTHSSSAPPPPSTTSITITPDSGLSDRQFVHVVGAHFTANERLVIIECIDKGEQTQPSDCNVNGAKFVRADGSGSVDRTVRVYKTFNHQTCGSPTPCLVTVSPPSQASHADEADEQIFFS